MCQSVFPRSNRTAFFVLLVAIGHHATERADAGLGRWLTSAVAGGKIGAGELIMRAIIAVVAFMLALAAVGSLTVRRVAADPPLIGISSAFGPIGTVIEVSHLSWTVDTEIRLYAAFSTDQHAGYTGSEEFIGPIAVTRSNAEGQWTASIDTASISGLEVGGQPGYIFIRAEGDMPPYMQSFQVQHFIVTYDGQRPPGSGAIEVAFAMAEGELADLAVWGHRRVGGTHFTSSYGLVPVSFEPTIPSVGDGEFEIVAVTNGGHEPIGPNTVDVTGARLCLNPSCHPSAPIIEVHSAFRVTVQNAEIVEANIALGSLPDPVAPAQEAAIDALATNAPPSDNGRAGLIAGASALLAVLVVGAAAVGYRRATAGGRTRAAKL